MLRSIIASKSSSAFEPRRRSVALAVVATLCMGLLPSCGGSDSSNHVQEPLVRNFSPQLSPIDFNNLIQNPTFSNSSLTVSTDPNYPGKIVIFFQEGTEIDPSSVFTGGNSFLGPDPSALQITREVPGIGNQLIPVDIVADTDRLICQPLPPFAIADGQGNLTTNMPDGQYTIGVFRNIKNTEGKSLRDGPVFHSFTIGATDALPPRVVTTDPVDGEQGVGAGLPPPAPPIGLPTEDVAEVTTSIFGDTTPDVTVRFSEGIAAASVNSGNISVVDAGAFVPGGGNPPQLLPAPGFPKLKSADDGATLPSNGHEIIWRVDPTAGFPFGTQIQVTVLGLYDNVTNEAADMDGSNPDNTSPIRDLAGNFMRISSSVQFQTIAPPDLPNNPLPEYSIWYATTNRIGAIDTVNLRGYANFLLGNIQQFPQNVLPQFSDTVATDQNIPNFDPFEILVDPRHSVFGSCHTYVYVQSNESNQIAIVNSRTSLPIALISTPSPGGIGLSVADNSTDILVVTNAAANTFTAFSLNGLLVGQNTLNAPIFVAKVQGTGNTPTAIAVTTPGRGTGVPPLWNRDTGFLGPQTSLIMWADFADGAVNTITLSEDEPVKTFSLGADSAPNDISFSPCFGGLMFGAISQGRTRDDGKVSYYVAGPGCGTGVSTGNRPDAIVGSTQETMDAPDGLDQNVAGLGPIGNTTLNGPVFIVAESGSTANRVTTLGLTTGAANLPSIEARIPVGANPTSVAHTPSWLLPSVNDPNVPQVASCAYEGLLFWQWQTTPAGIVPRLDTQLDPSLELYVCAQGAGQVNVVNMLSGTVNFYQPIPIDGIRHVASQASQ